MSQKGMPAAKIAFTIKDLENLIMQNAGMPPDTIYVNKRGLKYFQSLPKEQQKGFRVYIHGVLQKGDLTKLT